MKTQHITVASVTGLIAVLAPLAGAILWYDGLQAAQHEEMMISVASSQTDLDLRLVEAELKHLRDLADRRELTADEKDRLLYLRDRRRILMEAQSNA
jgi:hypothetical protein